jgi:hypothetical protein
MPRSKRKIAKDILDSIKTDEELNNLLMTLVLRGMKDWRYESEFSDIIEKMITEKSRSIR